MVRMYSDPSLVQDKIKNAKELVAKYNWQIEKRNLIGFYKELLIRKEADSAH